MTNEEGGIDVDLMVVGVGLDGCLAAARSAREGKRVLNVGRIGEEYGGQHATIKGVDRLPLLVLSNGPLASQLVELGAADYLAFRPVQSITVFSDRASPMKVPLKKEHVMLETSMSLRDKRRLMSLFQSSPVVHDPDEHADRWLGSLELDEAVQDMVAYGVCCLAGRDDLGAMTATDMIRTIQSFYRSLPQPLLYPIHGSSEISQALSRVAAVCGAIHVLNQPEDLHNMVVFDKKGIDIHSSDRIECDVPRWVCQRAVASSQEALYCENGLHLYVYPPPGDHQSNSTLFVLQIDGSTNCCRSGFMLHFWSFGPEPCFRERIGTLFHDRAFLADLEFSTTFASSKTLVH